MILGLCALCRQALESSGNAGLIKGFYWSIVLIGGVPLLMMAIAVLIFWRAHLKQCAKQSETPREVINA